MMHLFKTLFTFAALLASISSAQADVTYDFTAAYESGSYAGYVDGTPLTGYITLSSNAPGVYADPIFASSSPDFNLANFVVAFSVTDGLNTDTSLDYFSSEININSAQELTHGYLFSSNFYVGSNFGYSYRRDVMFSPATFTLRQATAAVPEPETYAMFLAGLGLLGFAAKRQKRA